MIRSAECCCTGHWQTDSCDSQCDSSAGVDPGFHGLFGGIVGLHQSIKLYYITLYKSVFPKSKNAKQNQNIK